MRERLDYGGPTCHFGGTGRQWLRIGEKGCPAWCGEVGVGLRQRDGRSNHLAKRQNLETCGKRGNRKSLLKKSIGKSLKKMKANFGGQEIYEDDLEESKSGNVE